MEDAGAWALLLLVVVGFFGLIAGLNALYFQRYRRHGYRPLRKPDTPRPRYAFAADRSTSIRGGSLFGMRSASYPSVTLQFDENWASVTGTFSRDVWIARSNVTEVAPVPTGIMFRSGDGAYDGLLFRCPSSTVLGAFVHYGWPMPAPDSARR